MNAKQEAEKYVSWVAKFKGNKKFIFNTPQHQKAIKHIENLLKQLEATEHEVVTLKRTYNQLFDEYKNLEGRVEATERKLAEANKVVDVAKTFVHVFDREGQTIRLNPMDKKFRKALSDYEASKEYISQEGE